MEKNQVALVTGAGRGIGAAIAEKFADLGYSVVVNDIDGEKANQVADAIDKPSIDTLPITADVSSTNEIDEMVTEVIEAFDRIDILINNAGIQTNTPFLALKEEEWDSVLETNLKGAFFLTQRVANEMIEREIEGSVVNITSIHQDIPRTEKNHYDASKAGMWMITKDIALELAEYRINVNAVAPGAFSTPMNQEIVDSDKLRKKVNEKTPWDRLGQPEEVADVVEFLSSERAEYITGSYIRIDGGRSLM